MDHDDTLSDNALEEVALAIDERHPDIIYSDEDKITDDGKIRHSPYFKPDWSPHLFLFTNYTNHLSVIKKDLVIEAGGLNKEYNGSQDYELLLRIHSLSDRPLKVHHIPKILYHWREAPHSTASDHSKKAYAYLAGIKALDSYFARKRIKAATSAIDSYPGYYKQEFSSNPKAKVNLKVTIPGMDDSDRVRFIENLKKMTQTKLEISYDDENIAVNPDAIIVEIKKKCLPTKESWLDELVGICSGLDDIRTVSPRILDASGRIVIDAGKTKPHPYFSLLNEYSGLQSDDHTPTGATWWVRDVVDESSWVTVRKVEKKSLSTSLYHVVWSHVDFKACDN